MKPNLFILFVLVAQPLFGQWQELTADTDLFNQRVFFNSATKGTVVGINGGYQRTWDGGITWDTMYIQFDDWSQCQRTPYASDLGSIFFPNDSIGYIGGQDGDLFKTTDGGNTWFCQGMLPTWNDVTELYFFNSDTGVAGDEYTVYRTTDGGLTWTWYLPAIWPQRFDVYNDSIVISAGDEIWRSTDYGMTWTMMNADTMPYYNDVSMGDSLNGIAVTSDGRISRTSDGGLNWTTPAQVTSNLISNIEMIDGAFGIITAGDNWWMNWQLPDIGYVMYTFDGGVTWLQPDTIGTKTMTDLFIINDTTAIVCGWHGNVLKHDSLSQSYILTTQSPEKPATPVVYPNPAGEFICVSIPFLPSTAEIEIEITDVNGRIVTQSATYSIAPYVLNVSNLPAGLYFLHCTLNGAESVSKFIVQ